MNKLIRGALVFIAVVAIFIAPGQAQSSAPDGQIDRLLKSLDGNSWIVGESLYGINYSRAYLDLRQTTPNTPKSEFGNKWYWMIYPLSNIDNLWTEDIEPFYAGGAEGSADAAAWRRISGFVRNEERCVFMLMPQYSVVSGRVGRRPRGRGYYDFGQYLRITEIRVHKEKIDEFEKFLASSFVPTATAHLSGSQRPGRDRLPRYLRVVKVAVNMSREPDFLSFLRLKLVPTVAKARVDMLVFHTIYGSEANYVFLFPYEKESDLPGTGERVLSVVLRKTHGYFEMLQFDSYFANLLMSASETIIRMRPELSPGVENKYARWRE